MRRHRRVRSRTKRTMRSCRGLRLTFWSRSEKKEEMIEQKLGSVKASLPLHPPSKGQTHLEHGRSRSSSSISVSKQVESVGGSFEVLVPIRSLLDFSEIGLSLRKRKEEMSVSKGRVKERKRNETKRLTL